MHFRLASMFCIAIILGCDQHATTQQTPPSGTADTITPHRAIELQEHRITVDATYGQTNQWLELSQQQSTIQVTARDEHPGTIVRNDTFMSYKLDPFDCHYPTYCSDKEGTYTFDYTILNEQSEPLVHGSLHIRVHAIAKPPISDSSQLIDSGDTRTYRIPTSGDNLAVITEYPTHGILELNTHSGKTFKYTAPEHIQELTTDSIKFSITNEYGYESDEGTITFHILPKMRLNPIRIPLTPESTTSLDISFNDQDRPGWILGNLLVTGKRNGTNAHYNIELDDFHGPNPYEPFTKQEERLSLTFYDNQGMYMFSLESKPFREKVIGIPESLIRDISYYHFSWTF
ncbi:hypothetical protein F7U66_01465 [Vibrio parahaemolyticus]|nr:hypothetical protein [Vibrio parahaemolyticus]